MKAAFKVFMVFIAVLAGYVAPTLYKDWVAKLSPPPAQQNRCLLSTEPCSLSGVSIRIGNDYARPLTPLSITVDWPNSQAPNLELRLKGVEMNMGSPRFRLDKVQDGVFKGTVTLPACTQNEMTWVGQLTDGNQTVYPAIRMRK